MWTCVLSVVAFLTRGLLANTNISETLKLLQVDYDHRFRPDQDDVPTNVSLEIYVESMGPLQEVTMDFTSSFYLIMQWVDSRLRYDGHDHITLKGDDIDEMWLPDLYFVYEKESHHHDVTQPNKVFKFYPDGSCRYVTRVTLKSVCKMELSRFPFDTQTCSVHMMSFAYSSHELLFNITDNDIMVEEGITISRYNYIGLKTDTYFTTFDEYEWEGMYVSFTFKRQLQTYILTVYIPSILLVIISWMSFWIDAHAAPARVSLGITTVLTATTMTASMQESFPDATYAKAVDIWLAACLMFVFLSLIEYAMANYLIVLQERKTVKAIAEAATKYRPHKDYDEFRKLPTPQAIRTISGTTFSSRFRAGIIAESSENGIAPPTLSKGLPTFGVSDFSAERLDKCARVLFACSFIAFNAFYWIFYLS